MRRPHFQASSMGKDRSAALKSLSSDGSARVSFSALRCVSVCLLCPVTGVFNGELLQSTVEICASEGPLSRDINDMILIDQCVTVIEHEGQHQQYLAAVTTMVKACVAKHKQQPQPGPAQDGEPKQAEPVPVPVLQQADTAGGCLRAFIHHHFGQCCA